VRSAILWNDGRAAEIVSDWHDDGTIAEIFARSGNVPFPGYTLPVLAWLKHHSPDVLEQADRLLFCKDWIRAWLTGVQASDETDASYAPFGIAERDWDLRLLELAGVADYRHLLPDLLAPDTTDPLLGDVAEQLGLPTGIPVAVGATDIVAGCVGGGAVEPGHAVTILGTSANSSVVTESPEFQPDQVGIMAAAPLGQWIRTMLNTSGSTTLDWAAGLFAGGEVGRLLDLAGSADTDDLPVLLPYLAGAGVVSPFVDPGARGGFLGLRSHHGPAELARAAVEGLAFAVADSYASMPTDVVEITAVGGAARSDLLLQTIADVTQATVTRPEGEEFGARGVALLAGVAAGLVASDDLPALSNRLDVDRTFQARQGAVSDRLGRYRSCSLTTRDLGRLW
jgi:sugar (pentulose or hexulose) kinase